MKSQCVTGLGAWNPDRHDQGEHAPLLTLAPFAKLLPRGPLEPAAQQHEQLQYLVMQPQQPQYAGSLPAC